MKAKKSLGISVWILIGLFILCIILNVTAWLSTPFCDWYNKNIFPLWTNTYGRITSLLPFSFGEILIWTAVIGIPLSLISLVILLIVKKNKRRKIAKIYGLTYLWIIAFVAVTETLNCFILYHCSSFGRLYDIPEEQYTETQLLELCDYLTEQTNTLSTQVQRDDNGCFVLTADLNNTAAGSMRRLGEEFPQLDGYYVKPKPVMYSFFMSQQYLMGIFFPFSMEANYNDEMYPSNLPDTVCHELAHTKGFIQEDEANFIAFLACHRSDNTEYRYSGYLNALKYVLGQVSENCGDEITNEAYSKLYDGVLADIYGNSDYWRSVQESSKGILDSKTVAEVSDKAMEASLKLNGVEDGKKSYGRMVDLLLNYYYSHESF